MHTPPRTLRLGVLVSGSGTNLKALIDASTQGRIAAEIRAVISDVPDAKALQRAAEAGIPGFAIERPAFPGKAAFEEAILAKLREHEVELLCLAGFMRIVGPTLLSAFSGRLINIHPALLPAFPGLHAQRQALEYGTKVAGCTVHFVDEKTDHGPIICQAAVEVREEDTEETLAARILAEEHRLYPLAVQLIAQGRVSIEGRRVRIAPES